MRNERVKELSLTAVLTAIVLAMGLIPFLGYIPITPMVGFTLIHIPVFIGAYVGGRRVGGFLGLVFGLTSLYVAWTRPAGFLDPIFTNPLVSVLPRFLVGFFAVDVLNLFKRFVKRSYIQDALFFVSMTFIHSIVVIALMYIAGKNFWYADVYGIAEELTREGTITVLDYVSGFLVGGTSIFGFLFTLLICNSLIEMALCAIVGTQVVKRLKIAVQ